MEMLLVVAISFILATAVGTIFLSGTQSYGNVAASQQGVEEGRSILEAIAKNLRMSSNADISTQLGACSRSVCFYNTIIHMYNNSQQKCVSYEFTSSANIDQAFYAECIPPAGSTPTCLSFNPCGSGTSYAYAPLSQVPINGYAYVNQTNSTSAPYKIGMANISLVINPKSNSPQTLETSVSFRDYTGIIQQ